MNEIRTGCGSCCYCFNGSCTNPNICTGTVTYATDSATQQRPVIGAKSSKCDQCWIKKYYASAFDVRWLGVDDCPFICEEKDGNNDGPLGIGGRR